MNEVPEQAPPATRARLLRKTFTKAILITVGSAGGYALACLFGWSSWPPTRHDLAGLLGLLSGLLVGSVLFSAAKRPGKP